MRLPLLLSALFILLSAGTAFAQEESSEPGAFYSSGIRMGSAYCRDAAFDCDYIASSQTAIIEAANSCVASRFAIAEPIMAYFQTSGEFENCVLPARKVTNNRGFGTWAVCCIKRSEDVCNLYCTRYIDQKMTDK
jgi:hypothetical protein